MKKVQLQYYETTVKNGKTELEALKADEKAQEAILEQIIQKYKAEGKTQKEIEEMADYQRTVQALENIQDRLQDVTISTLEAAESLRQMKIDQAIEDLDKSLAGPDFGSVEKEKEAWEEAMKYQERYYDETERLYQLDSLANKYDRAMNSDNITIKNIVISLRF